MPDVVSFEELSELMDGLHDCPFDLDEAVFDSSAQTWAGTFIRPLWADPSAEHHGLLFKRSRLPVNRVLIRFADVQNVDVADDARIGTYTFNEVERTPEGLRLRFDPALSIDVRTNAVRASYQENLLPGIWVVYRQFLLVQSGPRLEGAGS